MIGYLDIGEIISIITVLLYFIYREINLIIVILLWYHLFKGIITFILEYILGEGYISISALIDIGVGLFVFLRDTNFSSEILSLFMVALFIKSTYNILSPTDKIFGEE